MKCKLQTDEAICFFVLLSEAKDHRSVYFEITPSPHAATPHSPLPEGEGQTRKSAMNAFKRVRVAIPSAPQTAML